MAPASSRLSFFQRFQFEIRPENSIHDEFERLAKARNWKKGSKRKLYEKAWRECFGETAPLDKGEMNGQSEDEFTRVLSGLSGLNLEGKRSKREKQLANVARQFTTYYGMDDKALESWQMLCLDCGIGGAPASIGKCKKVNGLGT